MLAMEVNNPSFLSIMRAHAKEVSDREGSVTIDDVREYAERNGLIPQHRNVWGVVFSGRGWESLGQAASRTPSNHAHQNKVWKWVGA